MMQSCVNAPITARVAAPLRLLLFWLLFYYMPYNTKPTVSDLSKPIGSFIKIKYPLPGKTVKLELGESHPKSTSTMSSSQRPKFSTILFH